MQWIALELPVPVLGKFNSTVRANLVPRVLSLSCHWGRVGEDPGNETVLEHVLKPEQHNKQQHQKCIRSFLSESSTDAEIYHFLVHV